VGNASDAEIAVESLLNLSGNRSNAKASYGEESQDDASSHAPVPKLARLLRDGKGKFMYVGDSANLSFLQNIRRLVKSSIGDCALTTDPLRHALVESKTTMNPTPYGGSNSHTEPKPSLSEAKELVQQYLAATSGVLDLFDPVDIMEHLSAWANNASKDTDFTSSIYYLVLAIGAQVRAGEGGENLAEAYFTRGRHLVASNFMDDPSVFTIQSYALITMYMMIICRRNGADMNLGIAVRAAYALGLHRSDISGLFEARERRTRERVWKSLRILDIFLSASLGRPPATSEVDGGNVSWTKPSRDYEDIHIDGLSLSAVLRICFIFERILNQVYCRREVTAHLVESISQQYREWTLEFPGSLKVDGLEQRDGSPFAKLHQKIGITHLKSSYYWSIILLTRPFLVFKVSSHLKQKRKERVIEEPALHSPTQTFADACVDSAVRSMEIVHELCQTPNIPKRLPMLVNSVFISTLVFGIACFGDFDKTFPVIDGLNQAKTLLEGFARYDPLARRYRQITEYLHQAANEYIGRRDHEQMQQRRQDVSYIFGNIAAETMPNKLDPELMAAPLTPTSQQVPEKQDAQKSLHSGGIGDMFYHQRPTDSQSNGIFSQGPSITTSGVLATASQPDALDSYDSTEPMGGHFPNFMSPDSSGIPSNPSYGDEFPLFSLLTDFDPMMPDPFLISPR
jgi:Fungal specific transcription factor domain